MEKSTLESLGLTRNETKVYLTLLKLGQNKTGPILKESGLNSGKIYEILEGLKHKGLVNEIMKDDVRMFSAAPPEQLREYLDQKREQLKQEEKVVEELIPQLQKLRKQTMPTKRIVTYSGFRGIITAAEEALADTADGEEILSLGISDTNAWSQEYWVRWESMREKKKISGKYILSEKGVIYKDLQKARNISVRIMELDTPVGIDIYGEDKVLILHYQEPISCTLIYDENTARTFRSYFEPLWDVAKP